MSSLANLSEITKSEKTFSQIMTQASPAKPLDAASLSALWSTLSLLNRLGSSELAFLPSHLTLYPAHKREIPPAAQTFLHDLTQSAHVTSASLACSSVLAGLSSESDEYGDVALWLGDSLLGDDREKQVVDMLGLDGGRIVPSGTGPNGLPRALAQIPETQRSSHVNKLTSLISQLENRFEFWVEAEGGGGSVVYYFLLGELIFDKERAWAGLVGAGIIGDLD